MLKNISIILALALLSGCIVNKRGLIGTHKYYSTMSPDIVVDVSSAYQYKKGGNGYMDHQYKNRQKGTAVYIDHELPMPNENNVDYYFPAEKWIFSKYKNETFLRQSKYKEFGQVWHFRDVLLPNRLFIRDLGVFTDLHDVFKLRYCTVLTESELDRIKTELSKKNYSTVDSVIRNVEKDINLSRFSTSGIELK